MASEVFRFVSLRAPVPSTAPPPLDLNPAVSNSALIQALRSERATPDLAAILATVAQFVAGATVMAGEAVIKGPPDVDPLLIKLGDALSQLDEKGFDQTATNAFSTLFGQSPAAYVQTDGYRTLLTRLAENIVAAAISPNVSAQSRNFLVQLSRILAVIVDLAAGRAVGKDTLLEGTVILPTGIFPLPRPDPSLVAERAAQKAARDKAQADRQAKLAAYAQQLDAQRMAIDEIVALVANDSATSAPPPPAAGRARRTAPAKPAPTSTPGFWVNETERASLSDGTRTLLQGVGLMAGFDPILAVQLIQNQMGNASQSLNAAQPATKLVKIGSSIFPNSLVLDVPAPIVPVDPDRHPGPCPPTQTDGEGGTGPITVPTRHGEAHVLGIADLMLVEQELARYELGEIAHIENVLRSEKRERRFKTTTTTDTTTTTETEQTTDKEQDLSSTERFDLQRQSQNVINDSASKQAGLTLSGSYGPTVSGTATFNTTSTNSKQQSDSASSTYAKETTSRAVSRIQQRILQRQVVRTVNTMAERDLHAFDNSAGSADISGIYRFVDKVYTAQVLNYGKRLMLEFILPEPAAFWRYALTAQPLADVPYTKPDPPGYCLADGQTFVPLQAADLNHDNYMMWASMYDAQDVQPPPPRLRIVSAYKKAPDSMPTTGGPNDPKIWSDFFEVAIPDGYLAVQAIISRYGETQLDPTPDKKGHHLVIQVQDQKYVYYEPEEPPAALTVRVAPTASIPVSINSLRFYNFEVIATVLCKRDPDAFDAWRLKTYFSIMQAYQAAKSKYDDAVQAAEVRASYNLQVGRNPDENRVIEQGELKRGCTELMSAQRFDSFDSVARNVAPYGYPEIDFDNNKVEARFIRLFEQTMEWENMTYLFYPYFWSRKDSWVTLVQLTDDDPLFNRFLQAGAARVQVPVRLGFEGPVLNYLAGIDVWDADGYLINGDGPELSMLDELKSQLENTYVDGPGTVSVSQASPQLVGSGTNFKSYDVNRRIRLAAKIYVIRSVEAADHITLTTPYAEPSADAVSYALGPVLVGGPWEIRVPTDLIKLGDYHIS